MKIDTDVLEWYKAQGKGYQTKINAVLRAHAFG
ncbi:MAG: BrnA antitoxin family protein [Treponema maltophilum]